MDYVKIDICVLLCVLLYATGNAVFSMYRV